ncbi:MAG: DUF5050 domain-containing protein [Bacillota bacterium]|nr:DUF5050 domain-containing protein [Bacillota bacterium]
MHRRIVCLAMFIIMLLPSSVLAATDSVSVSLPSFDVRLNDTKINNTYCQYPLIVYNDITYFPMTYDDCHFLGLETTWSQKDGLGIEKNCIAAGYKGYKTNHRNAERYRASIPEFDITVNGKVMNNEKEQYPLLVFRDVTYFPLTWRFAVDEFNWNYYFDVDTGLSIQSDNPVQRLDLPQRGKGIGVCIIDGYLYYQGISSDGKLNVYRSPISDVSDVKTICTMDTDGSIFMPWVHFFKQDDVVYFANHVGGSAIMSSEVFYRVNEDGQGEKILSGKLDFRMSETGKVIVSFGVPPYPGNLYYQMNGDDELRQLGDTSWLYGWTRHPNGDGYSCGPDGNIKIVGEWVYITSVDAADKEDTNKIYRININTNETVQVSDVPASWFSIADNKIYFVGIMDHKLYMQELQDNGVEVIVDKAISSYSLKGDTIYYITEENQELYKQTIDKTAVALLPDKKTASIAVNDGNVICILEDNELYGMVIFDRKGNERFKTSDRVLNAQIDGNTLVYNIIKQDHTDSFIVRLS